MSQQIRESLNETERDYIKMNIIEPMFPDFHKIPLFQTVDRAQLMMEASLNRLPFDKENYSARVKFERVNGQKLVCILQAKKRYCNEIVDYRVPINLG